MRINVKRTVKLLTKTIVILFAVYGASEALPSAFSICFWRISGLPVPPASSYYTLYVHNITDHEVIACATMLNDRYFGVRTLWQEHQAEKVGRRRELEIALSPGEMKLLTLPSEVDPRIGLLLLTARTEIRDGGSLGARQALAVYLLPWVELREGRRLDSISRLAIKENDLEWLDVMNDPAMDIEILRGHVRQSWGPTNAGVTSTTPEAT